MVIYGFYFPESVYMYLKWRKRISNRMQTEKSQPEDKRIMSERRITEFPALSVDPRVRISWSASETYNI